VDEHDWVLVLVLPSSPMVARTVATGGQLDFSSVRQSELRSAQLMCARCKEQATPENLDEHCPGGLYIA
jgi:hypothetical protein